MLLKVDFMPVHTRIASIMRIIIGKPLRHVNIHRLFHKALGDMVKYEPSVESQARIYNAVRENTLDIGMNPKYQSM